MQVWLFHLFINCEQMCELYFPGITFAAVLNHTVSLYHNHCKKKDCNAFTQHP